jgi:hypothetical protein
MVLIPLISLELNLELFELSGFTMNINLGIY